MLGVQEVSESNYKTFNGAFLTMFPWISSHNWWKLIIPVSSDRNLNNKQKTKQNKTWKFAELVRFQRKEKKL